jgi:hypothetical protein
VRATVKPSAKEGTKTIHEAVLAVVASLVNLAWFVACAASLAQTAVVFQLPYDSLRKEVLLSLLKLISLKILTPTTQRF